MDIRLLKEQIQLEQPAGAGQSQAVVEGEITLPGGLREETRVLSVDAMAAVDSAECGQDRLTAAGRVVFHALYTQGDPDQVHAMEATADFTHLMDLPGALPRSRCQVQVQVEHAEGSAHNGRLSLRAVVRLCARACSLQPTEALTGLSGVKGLEMRTQELDMKRTVASGSGDTLLREEFELPAALQISDTLYATARAQVEDVTGGQGRIGLSGNVYIEAVHASDMPGKPVVVTRHTLPFEHTLDLAGEGGDTLEGRVQVKDVAVISQEAGEGERTMRAEVLLGLRGWSDRREKATVLSDAYTTCGDDLRLTTREVVCRTEDHEQQAAESGKTLMMLPEGAPPVRSVLCAMAKPVLTGREQLGGRLMVEGMLEATLLYMTDGSPAPVAVFQEEPFRAAFAAEAEEGDLLTLCMADVDAGAITSDRVELRYVLHLTVSGVRSKRVRVVTDAQCIAAPAPDESIVLCFVQPGESMWDIARRYRVPMKSLREMNPEVGGEPKTGQGLVVWNRGI